MQEQVNRWLNRLAISLPQNPAGGLGLAPLSPVKREKHSQPSSPAAHYQAARILLRLLAERLTGDFPLVPDLLELLTGPSLAPPESEASQPIQEELAALPGNLLESWSLAGLHFWQDGANHDRKRSGSYYTSPALARYITAQALPLETAGRPILDPACGGGIFLLAALERLAELVPGIDPENLVIERLYGLDLNPLAVYQTRLVVLKRLVEIKKFEFNPAVILALAAQIRPGNALVGSLTPDFAPVERISLFERARAGDFPVALEKYREVEAALADKRQALQAEIAALPIFNGPGDGEKLAALYPFGWGSEFPEVFAKFGGFGTVVGNPPYVGFNDYSGVEKAYFAKVYPAVYNLKSDLLYYFIRRGVELLAEGGRLGFVTSRFWKEAAFATALRGWLLAETTLLSLEDLGGEQHFAEADVDVCLLFAARQAAPSGHTFEFKFAGQAETFAQAHLSGQVPWTWLRQLPAERLLLAEIAEKSCLLGEIALCRTGVQTGLDRVFFVDETVARTLEPAALKRAIKNGDIGPGQLAWHDQWLIYLPEGFDPQQFPAILAYLEKHRRELERRQRYTKPFPFYELQWPREAALFETAPKLVTPYKAPRNTFAVDRQGFYFSTDVVSIIFSAAWQLEDLAANILNSRLSTFQFRSYGKPMGGGQWDYYANPVKKLAFPKAALPSNSDFASNPLITQLAAPGLPQSAIDELVCDLYELTTAQRRTLNVLR